MARLRATRFKKGLMTRQLEGESAPGRMWDPAEVFLLDDLESRSLKWRGVFLKRRQIALSRLLI